MVEIGRGKFPGKFPGKPSDSRELHMHLKMFQKQKRDIDLFTLIEKGCKVIIFVIRSYIFFIYKYCMYLYVIFILLSLCLY